MSQPPTLIRNGHVINGTGTPARRADVLISDAVISAVEAPGFIPAEGKDVIDAAGGTVTPGFIDVHSHADNAPLLQDDDTSKILQGVTTEVVGNCGFSLAPRVGANAGLLDSITRRLFPEISWRWHDFTEFFDLVDDCGYVTNYAPLVGHHPLRIAALGMSDAAPDGDQMREMKALLDRALEAGTFGLSSGLIYPPGMFSVTDELVELSGQLPPDRPYVTHMRGEGAQLLTSIRETLAIGSRAGCRVHVSHLKSSGATNWGKLPAALAELDRARDSGMWVCQDVYPYTAGSTMLSATLPPWFQEGGESAVLERLRSAPMLERLREDLEQESSAWENWVQSTGWDRIVVASSVSHTHDGRSIAEIAQVEDIEPFDALVRVLIDEDLHVTMITHSMREDDLVHALGHELTMIGSDGLPPGVGGKPHPRMHGTFPRVLARYTRELATLTLPEAVRRMTSLPAESFGLHDRGVVRPGMAADLVAFDPDTVQDLATYEEPTLGPAGISWVMTNGAVTVRDGRYLGRRTGERLTPA